MPILESRNCGLNQVMPWSNGVLHRVWWRETSRNEFYSWFTISKKPRFQAFDESSKKKQSAVKELRPRYKWELIGDVHFVEMKTLE